MPAYYFDNQWLWLFFVTTPLVVFMGWRSVTLVAVRGGFAAVLGYVLLNLAVSRGWDLRLAYLPADATHAEAIDATADGASLIFYAIFGLIPSAMYVGLWCGLWLVLWWFRYRVLFPLQRLHPPEPGGRWPHP